RHLRQERPGRAGRRWSADAAYGTHHGRRDGLTHHARHAAGLVPRPGQLLLQEAARRRPEIARAHIGPGAAAVLALAGGFALRAGRVGSYIQVAIVASGAVDRKLDLAGLRLEHGGALHAGDAAGVLDAWRDLGFEPAHGGRRRGPRIGEAPGTAAPVALAPGRTYSRVAAAHLETEVVATPPVETRLRVGRRGRARQAERDQTKEHPMQSPHRRRLMLRPEAGPPSPRTPMLVNPKDGREGHQ